MLTQWVMQEVKLELKGSCFRWSRLYKCCRAHHWMFLASGGAMITSKVFSEYFQFVNGLRRVVCKLTQGELQRTMSLVVKIQGISVC